MASHFFRTDECGSVITAKIVTGLDFGVRSSLKVLRVLLPWADSCCRMATVSGFAEPSQEPRLKTVFTLWGHGRCSHVTVWSLGPKVQLLEPAQVLAVHLKLRLRWPLGWLPIHPMIYLGLLCAFALQRHL